jgi:CubicO group peptidase (beta-lactamase class C family)
MRVNRKHVFIVVILFSASFAGITSAVLLISSHKSFNSQIRYLMAKYKIPSLAAGIIINDSLVWANGFGDQPDLDTVYMIGSITKTFTATAIMQLNESSMINLDEDINNYLPFEVRHPSYSNIPITTHMLLTHTAGLQTNLFWSLEYYLDNYTIEWINSHLDFGENITIWEHRPTLEEFLNGSLTPGGDYYDPYNWYKKPGTEFHYSNAGFQLLGYLIEQITNQSFTDLVQENIFNPLNMTNSGYNYADFTGKNAIPYEWKDDENFEFPYYNLNVEGAGNLRSTVPDMAKYLIAYMNQGKYNETKLINPESVEIMHFTHVSLTGTSTEGFTYKGYGLGWFLYEENFKGHSGATPGFSANMYFKKTNEGSFGVILMFNRGSALLLDLLLLNEFIPAINALLLGEAEKKFEQTLSLEKFV